MAYFLFSMAAFALLWAGALKTVTVSVDGQVVEFVTASQTVGEALAGAGIPVPERDYISREPEERLTEDTIYIRRAVPFVIEADGQQLIRYSWRSQVREALLESECGYDPREDRLEGLSPTDPLRTGMTVRLTRVRRQQLVSTEAITPGIQVVANYFLTAGIENVLVAGENGLIERTYEVISENGVETARTVVEEKIVQYPVETVIERGMARTGVSYRGDAFRYAEVRDMIATAYTLAYDECGKYEWDPGYGITAAGYTAQRGVVAVQPWVIPYGTRLYIETADGSGLPDYGYAVAGDTGYLAPNHVDLFVDTKSEAFYWGVRAVRVYILLD